MHRGALDLLSSYGGDSSDEEVPIGRVSTKRSCRDSEKDSSPKRIQTRLPIPGVFTEPFLKSEDLSTDNPDLHRGRIRSFPHERGNWATYVYIPYEPLDCAIDDAITRIVSSLNHLPLQPVDHFHISLTKTLVLKHHWIDIFMRCIKDLTSCIKRFVVVFDSINVYCNEERTRTFIGLDIKSGYDTLARLIEHLDRCLADFRLPPFYKNPSFHMSLLWCVGDCEAEIKRELPQLQLLIQEVLSNYPQTSWYNYVTHIECKSGNKLFKFDLS